MYRINFEAKAVGAMTVALPPFGQSLLTLIGMFIVALTLDPVLALLSLTIVPFIYYSVEFYGNRIEPRLVAVRTLESASLTIVNTAMSLLRVITAFNRQPHEYDRFRRQGEVAVRARVKLTVQQTLFSLGVAVMTAVGTALVLGIGAAHVLSGALTVGQLLVVMYYIQAIYDPLQTLSYSMSHFQEQLVGIRFASELLDRKPDIVERPGAIALARAEGDVRFEHVSFTYPGRARTLVQVNFHAAPGQVVAVVGTTGAGKSTLLSLIPRFIDPKDGGVFIDGHDIRDLTLQSVREQVAFVHQEPLLFERSIGENILYGRLDASPEDIVAAAKAANAHEFIIAFPQKYETKLGERGAKISGGERQRIAIARAFLKDSPILILDEPTSSVDSRTEAVILDAIERLMHGRTTFIVAHRLSTLRGADWVLVLDDGVIIEQGPPSELLVAGGMYAALQALQAGGGPNPRSAASASGTAAVAWRELVEHGAARNGT
jgi:ABC-type multidrug transport system fused ATPase/permease subunit